MILQDQVHKATSIHIQTDVVTMLKNLSESATVYVKKKSEFDPVGATNKLRGLAAKTKFTTRSLSQSPQICQAPKFGRRQRRDEIGTYGRHPGAQATAASAQQKNTSDRGVMSAERESGEADSDQFARRKK